MHELIPQDENGVAVVSENPLSKLVKPLQTHIFLFDSFIAGTSHLQDKSVLEEMKPGDHLLRLRENNEFDHNAIVLKDEKGRKAGYIPSRDNVVFARLMDAGKLLEAEVKEIDPRGRYWKISIGISLVDF